MIAYVEANFILELVSLQEEREACQEILDLAAGGRCRTVLPAFAVAEPFDVLRRRSSQRRTLSSDLQKHLRLLSRTQGYEERLRRASETTELLIESSRIEIERLHAILVRALDLAEVIPITADTLRRALDAQGRLGLMLQDSVILASVLEHSSHVPEEPKCLITRDAKDFLNPDIGEELRRHNRRVITRFRDGLDFVRAQAHD